jgi:hypothetical protein
VDRRVRVEADDVLDLGGEGRIVGPLEREQTMGLETMGVPDALSGSQRWATAPGGLVQVNATMPATTVLAIGAVPACGSCREAGRRPLPRQIAAAKAKLPGD